MTAPLDLTVDSQGNLLVADGDILLAGLISDRVWKIAGSATGVSVAGNGQAS